MQKIIQFKLKILAKAILRKYQPDIIGITGSVGKTSCKEAVYAILSDSFNVRKNIKNYNNEIGVPLTIIGVETGGRSLLRWARIFLQAIWMLLKRQSDYPDILILEMGADRPGDIDYLLSFINCKIGILTAVGESHIEFFGTRNKIATEKRKIISCLDKSGWAIVNHDNELAWEQCAHLKAGVMSFGIRQESTIWGSEVALSERDGQIGLSFKLRYQGTVVPIFLPNIISIPHVYAILAGVAVGLIYNLNLVAISDKVYNYQGAAGRTRLLNGIKHTKIIDDTYNSSPLSAKTSLELLKDIPLGSDQGRRLAVLGDMLELGRHSEEEHQLVGQRVAELGIDKLIAVGERARDIARGAQSAGMPRDDIFTFTDQEEAGHFIQNRLQSGDVVLVKGSQGVRMEIIVKEIMAEPERAAELLVRQDDKWLNLRP